MKKLIRSNPFLNIQHELMRALNSFPHLFESHQSSSNEDFEELTICPSMDVVEDEQNFKIEIEMPGMTENDIKVNLKDGMLNITGEKKTSKKDKDKNYLRREISYGYYERNIPLPDSVDTEQAKASFKKGMLWVTMPKKGGISHQTRQLQIEKVAS